MNKITNPFNPNAIVESTLFAGRSQQVLEILQKLTNVKQGQTASFVLSGERGIGKTALAKFIRSIASNQTPVDDLNFITSYYSVEKKQTLQSVLEASLNNITDDLPASTLEKLKNQLGGLFQEGKFNFGGWNFNIEIDKRSNSHADQKIIFKDQIISSLSNIIKNAILDNKQKGKQPSGILIIIDEVHNLVDLKDIAQIFRSIINTLDFNEKGYFSFMLIGYNDDFNDFFASDPSARRNFNFIKLDTMPVNEAEELLIKGLTKAKIKYDQAVLQKGVEGIGGYPHALQILGYHLVRIDEDNYIDIQDWQVAICQTALDLQDKDFFNFYQFNSKQTLKEKLMNILALANGYAVYKKDLIQYLGRSIHVNVNTLLKQGAIKEDKQTRQLSLQSKLFSTTISLYLIAHQNNHDAYSEALQIINKIKQQ